jgi:hypothetical protein
MAAERAAGPAGDRYLAGAVQAGVKGAQVASFVTHARH